MAERRGPWRSSQVPPKAALRPSMAIAIEKVYAAAPRGHAGCSASTGLLNTLHA